MAKMIVVKEDRCLGCKACVLECAMAHTQAKTLLEAISAAAPPQPRIHVEPSGEFGMPLQCRHCEDAPCLAICPTEAIHRFSERGPVLLDQERCIGCKFCLMVCPFGVIDLSRDGKAMIKCDLCIERTEAGESPACVAACPTKALEFCEIEDWLARHRRQTVEEIATAKGQAGKDNAERQDHADKGR